MNTIDTMNRENTNCTVVKSKQTISGYVGIGSMACQRCKYFGGFEGSHWIKCSKIKKGHFNQGGQYE